MLPFRPTPGVPLAHFAVIAPPLPGHLLPLLALARELAARGHRLTFVHQADVGRSIPSDHGRIGFHAVGESSHPPGSLDVVTARMARLGSLAGVRSMIGDVAAATDMLASELPQALPALGVQAVIADQMEPAGGLAAEALGLPFVTTATGLPINREPNIPPPYVPWPFFGNAFGRWLNRGGYRVSALLMRPIRHTLAHHCRRLGLPVRRRAEQFFSPTAQLAQAVRGLDFPRQALEPNFHYLGPFRGAETGETGLPPADGRPLVYCSLGTLQGSRVQLFGAVAAACDALGLRLLIAHGGKLRAEDAATLAGDPIVRAWVPQTEVLRHVSLAVTHAGFNTVLDSLHAGVPLVALPLAFEQPATAARLHRSGAGAVLWRGHTPARIARAMEQVLGSPSYRTRARALGAEIDAAGGVRRAADLVEASL